MKKHFLLLNILFHFCCLSFAQTETAGYERLFVKSDSLLGAKDYYNSATIGSQAIRNAGNKAIIYNYWRVADSWALSGYPDSAFYLLNILSNANNLAFYHFRNIRADKKLASLRNDKRWDPLLEKIYQGADKNVIDISIGVKIRMRDGSFLNATIYKPHFCPEPLPVIFTLTPYISDTYHERGTYFGKHDYIYANIDVRGRGGSEGEFDPFFNDARDGFDIVEWFAKQKFCNGKIAMWGGSYAGQNQWLTAKEFPPHLRTIVPVASPKLGIDHPMRYNIGDPYFSQWVMHTGTHAGNFNLLRDDIYFDSKFQERFEKDLPFASLDSITGYPNKVWKKYMAHQTNDNYYQSAIPNAAQYSKMDLPILTITGCYDANQPGALDFYSDFMKYATNSAKQKHYLIIGPWDHASTRTPVKMPGIGDSSLVDMNNLHWQWYNFALKDSSKPSLLRDKVMYFVTNRNHWKSAENLDDIGKEKIQLYLSSSHKSKTNLTDSSTLEVSSSNGKPAVYIYDPLNKVENPSLAFTSSPLSQEMEVSGFFQLSVYIETNVRDVDIAAEIVEITAAGQRIPLTRQTMRARFRESLEKEKLLVPGEINLFHFDNFTFISRVMEKGSRIELIISSPNSPWDQKNYCSGGNVALETAKDAHVATIKIYNDIEHLSSIFIPIVR